MAVAENSPLAQESPAKPGEIRIENHRLLVPCAQNTWLELNEIQLEGKKRLATAEFLRGMQLAPGTQLG
jgi:methionyl-tRNA formyltransferase